MYQKILTIVLSVGLVVLSVVSYSLYGDLKNTQKEFVASKIILEQSDADFTTKHEEAAVEFNKLSEQISVLNEAISPAEKRWAKIKKIRRAVQDVVNGNGYPSYLDINGLTVFASAVVDFSEQYDVSVPLILAVTTRESAFNVHAASRAGAQGLMQLLPETAKECANDVNKPFYNIFKIRDNVQLGTWYLWKMIDIFKGDIDLAVRAYNAGPTNVHKVEASEEGYANYYRETVDYHDAVMKWKKKYEDLGL